MSPTGTVRRAAVLGHPIGHSLSPALHAAAYRALGLTGWTYQALDTTVEQLPAVLASLDASWAGLSVTMPLKVAVGPFLQHVEPLAEAVGSVNTVLVQPGRTLSLVGANTDVHGLVAALGEGMATRAPGRSVVLGGGATAASALAALAQLGQPETTTLVRSPGRAGSLVRAAARMGVRTSLEAFGESGALGRWADADTVVSTLPPHAADGYAAALLDRGEPLHGVLLDCAYDPRTTALGSAWRELGGTVVGGERMLLHQAVEQVRLMTGHPGPVAAMAQALDAALAAPAG